METMTEREQERAAIVVWLRSRAKALVGRGEQLRGSDPYMASLYFASASDTRSYANDIENGKHL